MRYVDLIKGSIVDLLTALDAEGISTVPVDTLVKELRSRGMSVEGPALLDVLETIPVVNNVADDIIYFNSDPNNTDLEPDQAEKDDNKVDKLARKQVNKELKK